MSPSQYLTFPLLHTPNLSNGVSSQKCPGILNSKALGLLRRARSSRSRKESDSTSFPQQLLSSWHVAPVHLALLGQNCWPHLSEGFSVSLWFNVECTHEAERTMEKGKKTKKRNKSLILRDSSLDRTGMMFLLSVTWYTKPFQMAVLVELEEYGDMLACPELVLHPKCLGDGRPRLTKASVVT